MAQLSRPFQIAFVAVALLAGVWLFALQGHSTSTSSSGSTAAPASAPATSAPASSAAAGGESKAAAEAKAAGTPTPVYHGAAPGVEGLTRDIAKAHEAVATSERNARQLEAKSAQASDEAASAHAAPTTAAAPVASARVRAPATKVPTKVVAPRVAARTSTPASPVHKSSSASGAPSTTTPSGQRSVESALAKGDVVVLLFWNPSGAEDVSVHRALRSLPRGRGHKLAVQEALVSKVASYGSITRGVSVVTTPTLLVIDKQGKTLVLTGVQDAFSIEQAIGEARSS